MNDNHIESLKEALIYSPDNVPLRLLLAETLVNSNRLDEAETEYSTLLKYTSETKIRLGLAHVFYMKGRYSACNVILEDIIETGTRDINVFTLYAKGLLKENSISGAMEAYKKALAINPGFFDEELDAQLRLKGLQEVAKSEPEDEIDDRFLQKPGINFNDVGGMDTVKKEIELKIIKPLLHPELYKAYGKKTGGGILLYGPPGCGKTFIAKATAGQVNAKFLSVGLNDILDMWIGNSEKNLHGIFELARQNAPCVLFIDEIDALGASRSDMKQSNSRHLINQFLQELDGIDNSNDGVLIIGATNTPWNLDPAFRRPGRFDRILFIPPPDEVTKESILKIKLKNKPVKNIDYVSIAKKAVNYSGADIDAIIDIAIEEKLESSFADGIPKPIDTNDLLNAIKKHKASTQEWFMTAKNFAMFANDTGLYDDILVYMKLLKK
ncbi:AAA family ATPase [Polluticaenibacter yanchengensis]|uniref:AAA family ATPase n=1 Tax=Polluticaenibacter yanchengensis TaxID=3014562 RepID=A0ABT4UGG5_9BACT|nr:AAA family ATPase [Chitinophagaceae bacterium LY-5]